MTKRTRRTFIREATVASFGTYVTFAAGACKRAEPAKVEAPKVIAPKLPVALPATLVTFSAQQFITAAACAERILPRDDDPGAIELGVPEYMDRALATDDLSQWRVPFTKGLEVLDRQSSAKHQRLFAELEAEQQDAMLSTWQTRGQSGEKRFFEILLWLTFEGAFGDPTYGGNRDGNGFRLVGFLPPEPMPGMHLVKPLAPRSKGT